MKTPQQILRVIRFAGGQTIYVRTESVLIGDFIITPVNINSTPLVENNPPDLFACDTDDNGVEAFDFMTQSIQILGSQDASLFNIIYSRDSDFSIVITTPISY